jgi:outer membrane biosynthesis protein TonB
VLQTAVGKLAGFENFMNRGSAEMVMVRSILFAGALLATGAVSAQDVAISGKDFLSGAADAKIAELARQAAASGRTLVISAPPYWQDKAAAKAHAGAANASVRLSDAFFENVMVRVEDKAQAKVVEAPAPKAAPPPPAPRPEPKVESKPETKTVRAEPRAVAPEPKPEPPPVRPIAAEPPPAPKAETVAPPPAPVPAAPVAAAPAPVAPPPVAAAAAAKPAAPAADPTADIRKRFTQNLNAGQAADGTLQVAQLEKDDVLFVDGPVRAVVRRFGPRTQMYWLEGELNLDRAELVPTGADRYRITEPVRNISNPSLRGGSKGSLKFTANVPAAGSPARKDIEARYNDGRDIPASLQPADLRQGDLLYTSEGSAVIVRRTSGGVERYWLVGQIDLRQNGLQTQGSAVRVLTDAVK